MGHLRFVISQVAHVSSPLSTGPQSDPDEAGQNNILVFRPNPPEDSRCETTPDLDEYRSKIIRRHME